MTLVLPNNYEVISEEETMEYTGGGAGIVMVALYQIANFVVTKWDMLTTAYDFVDNVSTLISMVQGWRQRDGKYKLKATWVPGGNSNIYPPHSAQGATGYWTYSTIFVKN